MSDIPASEEASRDHKERGRHLRAFRELMYGRQWPDVLLVHSDSHQTPHLHDNQLN